MPSTTQPQQLFEAEENLISYLPHLCLWSQFDFSFAVMLAQLLGFGIRGNLSLEGGGLGGGGGGGIIILSCLSVGLIFASLIF
jgi:hypothetical protein